VLSEDLQSILSKFVDHLQYQRSASPHTLRNYKTDLEQFFAYLESKTPSTTQEQLAQVTNRIIRTWLSQLHSESKQKSSITRKVSALRNFFNFLIREQIIEFNPATLVALPHKDQKLPNHLSQHQISSLLETTPTHDFFGTRNKAILELLYATGLRTSELVSLNLEDINLKQKLIHVRQKPERIIPFGESALLAFTKYLPTRTTRTTNAAFVTYQGQRITPRAVNRLFTQNVQATTSTLQITPRILRHSFAVHLLDRGADLRDVQILLGHARITSTQRYRALTTKSVIELYNRTHPLTSANPL